MIDIAHKLELELGIRNGKDEMSGSNDEPLRHQRGGEPSRHRRALAAKPRMDARSRSWSGGNGMPVGTRPPSPPTGTLPRPVRQNARSRRRGPILTGQLSTSATGEFCAMTGGDRRRCFGSAFIETDNCLVQARRWHAARMFGRSRMGSGESFRCLSARAATQLGAGAVGVSRVGALGWPASRFAGWRARTVWRRFMCQA